ncbi:unnamed protein product [Fusarium graminearum]|nr:hypothetical protein FGRA07_09277 [Fusarium graminearum]CAF3517961.1 unnamed protein product [Fusarium graminearum]CAF3535799.1 unnamed protein product [Fusarium graminearum]
MHPAKRGRGCSRPLTDLNSNTKRRSNENGLSDEFVYDSDADQEEPFDIDDVAQEEEDALMEEQHNDSDSETDDGHGSSLSLKRKANDT